MYTPAHILKTARRQMRKIRHRGPKTDTERRLLASADKQREQGLGWRFDGFSDWSTPQLLESLAKISIFLNEEAFRQQALSAGTPTKLAHDWAPLSQADGKWKDLPMLAARELWKRLLPDIKVHETVADELDALLENAEVHPAREELWLQAARFLVEQCSNKGQADREFFESVQHESGCDLVGWMTEVPLALLQTSHATQAPVLCLAFSQLADNKAMRALHAEILAKLGCQPDSTKEIEQLLCEFPSDPLVLYKASIVFNILGETATANKYLHDYEEAIQTPQAAASIAAAAKAGVALPRHSKPTTSHQSANTSSPPNPGGLLENLKVK